MKRKVFIIIAVVIVLLIAYTVLTVYNSIKNGPKAYIIENVHIITGDGKELFNKNVLIKDDIIIKISDKKISANNSRVIDGTAKTLMPGLIDSHMHLQGTTNKSEKESDAFLKNRIPEIFQDLLQNGVTTIKELGAPESFIFKLKNIMEKGEILGPNLLIVGPNITTTGGHPAVTLGGNNPWIREEMAEEIENVQQARQTVKRLAEKNVDFIKIVYQGGPYIYFDEELILKKLDIKLVNAIIDEAKKYDLKVTAHVAHEKDVLDLLQTDIYGLEHGVCDKYIEDGDEVIKLWKSNGVYYVPTLQVLAGNNNENVFRYGMSNLKILHDNGVKIALGTDNMMELLPGNVVHTELKYYVEAGLTEMQALVTATHNAAEYLGILDKTGTVEEGKIADLILLDSNPLEDIQNINYINTVFKDGNIVFSKTQSQQALLDAYAFPSDEALVYTDNTLVFSKNIIEKTYTLEGVNDSGTIQLAYLEGNNIFLTENYQIKKNLETTAWSFTKSSDGTDMKAVAAGDKITLSGKFNNKEVNKTYQLNSLPWMQMGMFNYGSFVKSDYQKISYYAIGTEGRGALSLTKFDSQKEGTETIELNGKRYECIKIGTVISEYSFIWKGYSWHDKETGMLVKYAIKGKEQNALYLKND